MASPLRLNAVELLRRPGSERQVRITTSVAELGVVDDRLAPAAPVEVDLRLEVLTDGVVVTGTVRSRWHGVCRRCAVACAGPLDIDVRELYQRVVTDPDAFELGDLLDLEPMVRELLLLDAPGAPLCRPECRGLCPVCGADLNTATCTCSTEVSDPRWAALDALRDALGDGADRP